MSTLKKNLRPLTRCLLLSLLTLVPAVASQAAIVNTPGLTTVRFWEATGWILPYDFAQNGAQMTTQLGVGTLGPSTNDFSPLTSENYDVFYSDANGAFNLNGDYVSVEAVFPFSLPSGGGLNLAAVDLIIAGSPVRADILASWNGLGNNFIAGDVGRAVDFDNYPLTPLTATTMGNTGGNAGQPPTQHLRVTVGWSRIPEPSTGLLAALSLLLAGSCRAKCKRSVSP
jgi:hypothetical protein